MQAARAGPWACARQCADLRCPPCVLPCHLRQRGRGTADGWAQCIEDEVKQGSPPPQNRVYHMPLTKALTNNRAYLLTAALRRTLRCSPPILSRLKLNSPSHWRRRTRTVPDGKPPRPPGRRHHPPSGRRPLTQSAPELQHWRMRMRWHGSSVDWAVLPRQIQEQGTRPNDWSASPRSWRSSTQVAHASRPSWPKGWCTISGGPARGSTSIRAAIRACGFGPTAKAAGQGHGGSSAGARHTRDQFWAREPGERFLRRSSRRPAAGAPTSMAESRWCCASVSAILDWLA